MSIGNVGQLTMDLITSSLSPNCYHIGYLHDPCILPVVGNDALVESSSSSGKLNVSAEGLFIHFLLVSIKAYSSACKQKGEPFKRGSQVTVKCHMFLIVVNWKHFT